MSLQQILSGIGPTFRPAVRKRNWRSRGRGARAMVKARAWPRHVAEALESRMLLAQSPYWGVPFAIPVTIQAEDFDNGGEGIAYHETTVQNIPGQYRETGVDVEACGDVGGGYDIGYIDGGEWLEYTVNVPQTGKDRKSVV